MSGSLIDGLWAVIYRFTHLCRFRTESCQSQVCSRERVKEWERDRKQLIPLFCWLLSLPSNNTYHYICTLVCCRHNDHPTGYLFNHTKTNVLYNLYSYMSFHKAALDGPTPGAGLGWQVLSRGISLLIMTRQDKPFLPHISLWMILVTLSHTGVKLSLTVPQAVFHSDFSYLWIQNKAMTH